MTTTTNNTTTTTTSTTATRSITTYTGAAGWSSKGVVTFTSFVGGLFLAGVNALAVTKIGNEIHHAKGFSGAVALGVDLSFRAVESLTVDKVKDDVVVVTEEEAEDLLK
jgi:hypothetical protein